MKEEMCYFLLSFVLVYFLFLVNDVGAITGEVVTGEIITGEATSGVAAMNITILPNLPSLTIKKPKNETYYYNHSLELKVDSGNANNLWYNLDNEQNRSFSGEAFFNTTYGNHTIYVFANNSDGVTARNVTFSVVRMHEVDFNEFIFRDNSTNFYSFSFEEIQNLSGIILEDVSKGKISFNKPINLTDDQHPEDGVVNISAFIGILYNRIELNSTALPNFNVSATLTLVNLTFVNPRIVRDGVVCPSNICVNQSYSGGVLVFNVSHFTVYSAEESSGSSGSGNTGGGGGGIATSSKKIKNFSFDIDKIKVLLEAGEVRTKYMIINNTGDVDLSVLLSYYLPSIANSIKIDPESFDLKPGETKMVGVDIIVKENIIPDLYIGKILIKAGGVEKEISIIIEVLSKEHLFDVIVEIPKKFSEISAGEDIIANIKLFNVMRLGKVDVEVEYDIRDFEGNIITFDSETIAIENQANFVKSLKIPDDAKEGNYLFYVRVNYAGKIASSSESFIIKKGQRFFDMSFLASIFVLVSVGILIIILLILVVIILMRHRKLIKEDEKSKEIY